MARYSMSQTQAGESEEAMLAGFPFGFGGNDNANETAVIYGDAGLLRDTIFEAGPKPRVNVARYIDRSCRNEVVPVHMSVLVP